MRVALIGNGAIASELVRLLNASEGIQLVGMLVRDADKPASLPTVTRVEQLLALAPDTVVECRCCAVWRGRGSRRPTPGHRLGGCPV